MPALEGMAETQHQDSPNVPGAVERGDGYGAGVLAGEFGQDNGREHLVVGAPDEGLGSAGAAGGLSQTEFETDASPSTGRNGLSWTQNSPGVAGNGETGDRFAARLSSVELTTPEDDTDLVWPWCCSPCPGRTYEGVVDAGMAYIGYAPGRVSVPLNLPQQARAGIGMVPMQDFLF